MTSRKKRRGDGAVYPEGEPEWLDVPEEAMFAGPERADTKTIQLCRQVEEAVSCALAGARSALLRDLHVVAVEPLRGAALLRVLVSTEGAQDDHDDIVEALERAGGYLRREVARAIHRKRVPGLQLAFVPPGLLGAGGLGDE